MLIAPFAWPGGKRALTPTLLKLLPTHHTYVEVFAGSAKLLFAKPPSPMEVVNDLNRDVICFFQVAKHRPAELAEALSIECIHAERFRELRTATPHDELSRALRFIYLTWYSYGSKGEHFASSNAKSPAVRRPLTRVRELLETTSKRLANVLIEQRDFADILTRYDAPETFFFADPPYVDFQPNGRYEPLPEPRREELFQSLVSIKGRFLLTFGDHPEIRSRAQQHRLHLREVDVPYSLGSVRRTRAKELLISNYDLPAA